MRLESSLPDANKYLVIYNTNTCIYSECFGHSWNQARGEQNFERANSLRGRQFDDDEQDANRARFRDQGNRRNDSDAKLPPVRSTL